MIHKVKELNNRGINNLKLAIKYLNNKEKVESQKEFNEEVKKVLEKQLKEDDGLDDYARRKRFELIEYVNSCFQTLLYEDHKNKTDRIG